MGDTYIKLNDALPEHRKIVAAGGDAGWLHVCGLAYASRNLSDGRIPIGMVPRLSDRKQPDKLAKKLCEVRLWHAVGHDCDRCPQPADDEYVIHDYLNHQRSAEDVSAIKEKRAAAGRRGGSKKAANTKQRATAGAKQTSSNLLDGSYVSAEANETPEAEEVLRTSQTEEPLRGSQAEAKQPQAAAGLPQHPAKPTLRAVTDLDPRFIAHKLLDEHIDACRQRPPRDVLQKTGEKIDALVAEGIEPSDIRKALALLRARPRLGPGTLPNLVHEARSEPADESSAAARPGRSGQNVHRERGAGAAIAEAFN
ncbi:hypothetical protein ACGFNU_21560 [Spirillospora sp. NPDC048911]|uniref:hypothetical protein n=1 Tax=Spirillospora sp. NPDC048911 TaxID=3364527 RepID=UPI003715D530